MSWEILVLVKEVGVGTIPVWDPWSVRGSQSTSMMNFRVLPLLFGNVETVFVSVKCPQYLKSESCE